VEVRLREYRPEDFDSLWEIDQSCFPQDIAYSRAELSSFLRLQTSFALIAEATNDGHEQGRPAGFIIAQRLFGPFGHIITIDVSPAVQRNHIGTLLLRTAHQRLKQQGCKAVYLETAVNNTPALAFYKRHGYSILKTLPRYYQSSGIDAFRMVHRLTGE
jgi:ribosomal protein S18 acetylase RimI-like enzyme